MLDNGGARFPAEVSISDSAGDVDLKLEVNAKSPSAPMAEVAQIADSFVAAVNAGMFAHNPAGSRFSMQVVAVDGPSEGRMRYVWRARGVPPEAYRVLLNMLAKSHYSSLPLESVRLASPSKHNRQLNRDSLMAGPFPARTAMVPFEVRHAATIVDSKEPTIRLEFQRAIRDEEMEGLVPLFVAWDSLIGLGGYLESFDDKDLNEFPLAHDTYLAAPATVEHLLFGIVRPEAAFDALINMAVSLHHTLCPLTAFEVE
jgi:hypothetical protein